MWSNYGICGEWETFINLDIHGDKILKLTLLTFGFGGLCVCTNFYFYTFPYDNTIIIWIDENKNMSFGLMFLNCNPLLVCKVLGFWSSMIVSCYNPWKLSMPKLHRPWIFYCKCWVWLAQFLTHIQFLSTWRLWSLIFLLIFSICLCMAFVTCDMLGILLICYNLIISLCFQ